jgi:predicted dehydrogenase
METIRIGLVGAGGNTKSRHIPGFNKMDGIQLLSVANRSIKSSRLIVEEFNVLETAKNWNVVIEDERIDAVCIGTWPYMHCPITISALNRTDCTCPPYTEI